MERISVSHEEMVAIMNAGIFAEYSFGPGHVELMVKSENEDALRLVLEMRQPFCV